MPELFHPIQAEDLEEAELGKLKDELVQPFSIVRQLLWRCRVFRTEAGVYLFFDVHHTVFDGTSAKLFFSEIMRRYRGEITQEDWYYLILAHR